MVEDATCSKPNSNDDVVDEEARLKDKLESKKKEVELKNKLMAKKERRNSENEDAGNNEGGDQQLKDSHSFKESPNDNHGGSGSRSSSSQRYIVPQRRGSESNRGPPHGRGGRGGGACGGPHGRPYFEPDPYGRGPPPPPDRYHRDNFRVDFGCGPPPHFRGGNNHFYDEDQYGRAPPRHYHQQHRSRSHSVSRSYSSRSRSASRSYSRSRSHSRSRSPMSPTSRSNKRGRSEDRGRGRHKHRRHRSRRSRSPSSSGSSISSSSSSSSSSDESEASKNANTKGSNNSGVEDSFTKDQRTVFVNQLVMRTTSRDIKRYFRRKVQAKVNEVQLLTDRRTGKHKGCAYVEMKSSEDVKKALNVSGQPPDFQRFPILIKPSEAEKNYLIPASSVTVTANMMGSKSSAGPGPMVGTNGQFMESQRVYVGSLDPTITQEHLYKLFSQFGHLTKVQLQMEPASGISKGFAFLSFRDPKEANLAIQTMSNQVLGGRPMKTGWATQQSGTPGVHVVTSEEFPDDASARAQKAHIALAQLTIGAAAHVTPSSAAVTGAAACADGGGSLPTNSGSKVPTVAEARHNLAAFAASGILAVHTTGVPTPTSGSTAIPDAKVIGRAENPSKHLLISNMFDKDKETEPGWAEEIKEEFKDECQKFGEIEDVLVMSKGPGGKIYASFGAIEAAKMCASSLAGRWFDKRQLRVEFVDGSAIPKEA